MAKITLRGFISDKFNSVRENSTMTSIGWKESKEDTKWSNMLVCVPKKLQEAFGKKVHGKDLVSLEGDLLLQNKQVISAKFIESLGSLKISDESKLIVAEALRSHLYNEQIPMVMVRSFSKLDRTPIAETQQAPAAATATADDIAAKIAAILNAPATAAA